MSSNGHNISKMITGMRKPPLIAGTNKYATVHDKEVQSADSQMQKYYENDVLEVYQPEPKSFEKVTEAEREMRLVNFEENQHILTAQFYKKIQDLKSEHNKTLEMLEKLYVNADDRCHKVQHKTKTSTFITDDNELINGSSLRRETGNIRSRDNEQTKNLRQEYKDMEFHAEVDVELEPRSRIEEMWNDFKMKDFIGPDLIKLYKEEKEESKRPKSAPVNKKWQPIVTVPKPFSMTIREEMKKEKDHTKSSKEVADEWKRKRDEEEQELKKKVKAKDPPAHTFLPLYEEIVERQQQRSRMNRENASLALKQVMKPFSFDEDQDRKIKESIKRAHERKRKESREIKKMSKFVANGIPSSVYDPRIDQKLKENELYREIKVKLRSEDTMRASALPPRMQAHQAMRKSYVKQPEMFSFRPQTTKVPNFSELHRRDQMEMTARKMENVNTLPEPFYLRSAERGEYKNAIKQAQEELQRDQEDFENSIEHLNRKVKMVQITDPIPQRMTESARLRLEKTRTQIAKAEKELEEMKRKVEERKKKRVKIAKEVVQRVSLNADDPQKEILEKVQRNKHQTRLRDLEYAKELKQMNENINRRPFMFETVSTDAALKKQMKKCDETLRDIDIPEYQSTPVAGYDSYSDFTDDEIVEVEQTNEVTKKLEFD